MLEEKKPCGPDRPFFPWFLSTCRACGKASSGLSIHPYLHLRSRPFFPFVSQRVCVLVLAVWDTCDQSKYMISRSITINRKPACIFSLLRLEKYSELRSHLIFHSRVVIYITQHNYHCQQFQRKKTTSGGCSCSSNRSSPPPFVISLVLVKRSLNRSFCPKSDGFTGKFFQIRNQPLQIYILGTDKLLVEIDNKVEQVSIFFD